jgi:hypothetical protein
MCCATCRGNGTSMTYRARAGGRAARRKQHKERRRARGNATSMKITMLANPSSGAIVAMLEGDPLPEAPEFSVIHARAEGSTEIEAVRNLCLDLGEKLMMIASANS